MPVFLIGVTYVAVCCLRFAAVCRTTGEPILRLGCGLWVMTFRYGVIVAIDVTLEFNAVKD